MTTGPGIFDHDAATTWVTDLRAAAPTSVGDAVSGALRTVAQAEQPLAVDDVRRALAALALLLAETDPGLLDGLADADEVRQWFTGLEIELNPARRQIADGTIDRILLGQDNGWYDAVTADQDGGAAALAAVQRLRDVLADIASGE